jgi:cell division protein FtsL
MAALFGSSDALMEAGLLLNDGLGSVRKAFEQAIVGMRAEKEKLHLELQLEQERSQLLLEQGTAGAHLRVETIARTKLNMTPPNTGQLMRVYP